MGHLHVEEDEVERLAVGLGRRGERHPARARVRLRARHPPPGGEPDEDVPVDRVVVDDEHAPPLEDGLVGLEEHAALEFSDLGVERERGPRAHLALDRDLPTHHLGKAARDREAQPGPPVLARRRGVGLRKALEHGGELVRRDPDSCVLDGHVQPHRVAHARTARVGRDPDAHAPLGRELDRVREQVDEHLPHARHVAPHAAGHAVGDGVGELDAFVGRRRRDEVERRLDAVADVERRHLEVDLSGLDLRKVEDVVDDAQQGVARRPDRLHEVGLLGVEFGVEQQRRHPDHAVHGRPDLVAHVGQELALGPRPGLGRLAGGLGDLLGLAQLVLGPALGRHVARDADDTHHVPPVVLERDPGDLDDQLPLAGRGARVLDAGRGPGLDCLERLRSERSGLGFREKVPLVFADDVPRVRRIEDVRQHLVGRDDTALLVHHGDGVGDRIEKGLEQVSLLGELGRPVVDECREAGLGGLYERVPVIEQERPERGQKYERRPSGDGQRHPAAPRTRGACHVPCVGGHDGRGHAGVVHPADREPHHERGADRERDVGALEARQLREDPERRDGGRDGDGDRRREQHGVVVDRGGHLHRRHTGVVHPGDPGPQHQTGYTDAARGQARARPDPQG